MSVVTRFDAVQESFQQDALRLLHQAYAPVIVAVLGELYGDDEHRSIAASDLHSQIDAFLDDLSEAFPATQLPKARGRDLAYSWVEGASRGWLRYRDADEPGAANVYEITPEALDALRYVQTRRHALVSESRVKGLIAKVEDTALMISEDRERRIAILDEQIERLTKQRDELLAGDEMEFADDFGIVEALDQILSEVNSLPSDIRKVSERFAEIREQVRVSFRDSDLSAGEVLDGYQELMTALMNQDQGRAFTGAVELLQQTSVMRGFVTNMDLVLGHEVAEALSRDERQRLRRMSRQLSIEVQTVMSSHTQIAAMIRANLVSPDQIQARELRAVLRDLERRLPQRKAVAPVRDRMPVQVVPPTIDADLLRTKFAELGDEVPPPPLPVRRGSPMSAREQHAMMRMGGPDVEMLRRRLVGALKESPRATVAEVFGELPAEDRRFVDLLGLFQVSSATTAIARAHRDGLTDTYSTVHPLGESTRVFHGPRLTYTDDDRAVLIELLERG